MKKDFLKKVMAVVVVGAMTMGLVACGNGNSGNVSESTQNQENSVSGEEKETNTEGYLVGYSLNSMDSTMKQMADYFENVALERGWTPVLQNANGDVSTELNNMESLMNMGCDAVVIMGCDTEGSAAAIEE